MQISEFTQVDFTRWFTCWIIHFASLNFGFATWGWYHNLEMIPQLGGDFATWFAAAKMEAWAAKWHSCAKGGFHSLFCSCKMGFGLRNFAAAKFRTAWCGCLQTTITSSFQLRFTHRLKCWTPEFPSFKRHIVCIKWTPGSTQNVSNSCCPLEFLHVRFLSFSSFHSWFALAKNYEAPKLELIM